MKRGGRLISFFILFVIGSCISPRFIDIQVLEPGSVKIPKNLDAIHIIEPDMNSLERIIKMEDTSNSERSYYQTFIQSFDSTLKVILEQSPVLNNTEIVIEPERRFQELFYKIPENQKKRHASIRIERFILTDTIKPNTFIPENEFGFAYYSFYSLYCRFRVDFNTLNDKFIDSHIYSDTLTWRGKGNYRSEATSQIPTTQRAIKETAKHSADLYGRWLAPYWLTDERIIFYNGNKYMRKAYDHFLKDNFNQALENWKYMYEAGTPSLASVSAHNIAVLYEIQDDLNNCELWLKNALKSKYRPETERYLFIVQQRLKSLKILENQIKN